MPKIDFGTTRHVRTVVDPEIANVSSSIVYVYQMQRPRPPDTNTPRPRGQETCPG
jgi:hypothetical protein